MTSVLIIGGGAREHALSRAYEKSNQAERIIVAPGNDFIGFKREKEVVIDKGCSLKNPESLLGIAQKYKPDLIDVAQDDALAAGTVDLLQEMGFLVFGPTKNAARIEWDKKWSREFMQRHAIPHPHFHYFDDQEKARKHIQEIYSQNLEKIIYIKATGLCGGKGALKSTSLDEAIENINRMKHLPNGAGNVFLIEEGVLGPEFSSYAMSDGQTYALFNSAQDHKTVFNFDQGDQTGGMGAISPAMVTQPVEDEIEQQMISRAITGMASEGIPYKGILYLGGIIVEGKPMNIEYNARWGDPEGQVVLPSLQTDYVEMVMACLEGKLNVIEIRQDNKTRVGVVGASRGYPGDYSLVTGKQIYGLEEVMEMENVSLFGAGIDVKDGRCYAHGGRLFSVVAEGENILEARQRAYSAIVHITVEGNNLHYRTDIGWRDAEQFLRHSHE